MTPLINLVPWRLEQAAQKKSKRVLYMGVASLSVATIIAAIYLILLWLIGLQNRRNAYLTNEMTAVSQDLQEMEASLKEYNEKQQQVQTIYYLQVNAYQVIRTLDALPRWTPEGLVLTSFSQSGNQLLLQGRAKSHEHIATLMRNINNSTWLKSPQLTLVQNDNAHLEKIDFQLRAMDSIVNDAK